MPKLSQEEQKRIRETSIQELLKSGEWVKLYDLPRPQWVTYDYSDIQLKEKKAE